MGTMWPYFQGMHDHVAYAGGGCADKNIKQHRRTWERKCRTWKMGIVQIEMQICPYPGVLSAWEWK